MDIADWHSDDHGSHFPKWLPAVSGIKYFGYHQADVAMFSAPQRQ